MFNSIALFFLRHITTTIHVKLELRVVSFELMREQNLSEEEQQAVSGIWLNCLRDQVQPLADIQPEDIVETIRSLELLISKLARTR
jgi:hypothetical protein